MKRITLNSLTMTNFKGEKERTTVFNDGQTSIYGANVSYATAVLCKDAFLLMDKERCFHLGGTGCLMAGKSCGQAGFPTATFSGGIRETRRTLLPKHSVSPISFAKCV